MLQRMQRRESSYTIGGNGNWCSHYEKQYGVFLKKLKLKLLYDPVIPLVAIYLEKRKRFNWKDTGIPMFIAALFTLAKTWKQPKCWSADDWFKRMWYMDFPGGSAGKEFTCNAGDLGSIPGLGRSRGEGNGFPLQYSGVENSMDHSPWSHKESNMTEILHFHFSLSLWK